MEKLLTPKDVKEILGIGTNAVYKLMNLKGFPRIKIGKRYFISEEKLKAFLNEYAKYDIKF